MKRKSTWKKLAALLLFTFFFFKIFGQAIILNGDSVNANKIHGVDRYHQILRYNEPIMYLAFPVLKPILDRSVPLMEGEGKDGYWAEGHFGHRFVAFKGKYYNTPFAQRLRVTFDVSILTRLTRDNSNPLLPYNNKFGLGIDFLLSSLRSLDSGKGCMIWLTTQLHHYSNGQADSFFIDAPEKRNNYKSGDFSANYWRAIINISSNTHRKNLYMGGIGFQEELDLEGPLSSSRQLKNYYGDGRVLLFFHWVKQSKLTIETVSRGFTKGTKIKRQVRRHVGLRTELDYLVGDLSEFPHNEKFRLGWHTYFTYLPSVSNQIGLMVHTSLGRDYLNMRFDDVVFLGSVGLYITFD